MKQDILLTRFAAASSTIALALGFASVFTSIELGSGNAFILKVMLVAIFSISLLSLFYGNIVYQLTRIGQLKRHWNHRDDSNIEALHRLDGSPTVSILVPSYKEQIPVVMQTIMSPHVPARFGLPLITTLLRAKFASLNCQSKGSHDVDVP